MPQVKLKKGDKIIGVNTDQLKRLAKKYEFTFDRDKLLKDHKNGDPIFSIREKGKLTVYILHEIYIKSFVHRYFCHKDIKKGKELFISNFRLPNYKHEKIKAE